MAEARKFVTSNELAELEKATQDLTAASNKMAEALYKNAGAAGTGAGPDMNAGGADHGQAHGDGQANAQGGKKDEDVIDADFKQV